MQGDVHPRRRSLLHRTRDIGVAELAHAGPRLGAEELGLVEAHQPACQPLRWRLQRPVDVAQDVVRLHEAAAVDVGRLVGGQLRILRLSVMMEWPAGTLSS